MPVELREQCGSYRLNISIGVLWLFEPCSINEFMSEETTVWKRNACSDLKNVNTDTCVVLVGVKTRASYRHFCGRNIRVKCQKILIIGIFLNIAGVILTNILCCCIKNSEK